VRRALALAVLAAACLHRRPEAPPLLVGTSADYPPFSLARDGTTEGLDVEVARRFARDSGRRLELVRFRWPELTRDLVAGRFDLALGGVTLRPERAVAAARGQDFERAKRLAREGLVGERPRDEIGIVGLRAGDAVGDHTVVFGGLGERLELVHRAQSRDCLARGALRAARWVAGRPPGLYSMRDVLGL